MRTFPVGQNMKPTYSIIVIRYSLETTRVVYEVLYRTSADSILHNGAADTFHFFQDAYDYADALHSGAIIHGDSLLVGHDSLDGEGINEEALTEISESQMRGDFVSLWYELTGKEI
jgi:hypothetical protein